MIVCEKIKNSLIAGEYLPGQKLFIDDLVEKYGISRTPIIQAFKLLANERILSIGSNGRVSIPQYNEKEIRDTCEMRFLLEGFAIKNICASKTTNKFNLIEKALLNCNQYYEKGDYVKSCHSDIEFHRLLVDSVGNECLSDTFSTVQGRFLVSSYATLTAGLRKQEVAVIQHQQIFSAIRSFNENEALSLLQKHIDGVRDEIIILYTNNKI